MCRVGDIMCADGQGQPGLLGVAGWLAMDNVYCPRDLSHRLLLASTRQMGLVLGSRLIAANINTWTGAFSVGQPRASPPRYGPVCGSLSGGEHPSSVARHRARCVPGYSD